MAKRFSGGFLGLALASGFFLGSCHPQSDSALEEKQKNFIENFYLDTLTKTPDSLFTDSLTWKLYEHNSLNYLSDTNYHFSNKDLEKFNSLVDSTLKESERTKKNAIIINKSDYVLYVIKSGKVHSKYPIELGGDPYNDKERRGDMRTPEGFYKLERKLDKGQTAFYKAFLINYPNNKDRKKGKTGGMIEIHGCGSGKRGDSGGGNWTLGCIALSNKAMDEIFPVFDEGNRITIVRYTDINLDKKLSE